jgi:hypothetical protein
MKKFTVTLADEEGLVIRQFKVGAYLKKEADIFFEIDAPRENELGGIDYFVEIDGPGDLNDLGDSVAKHIRQDCS